MKPGPRIILFNTRLGQDERVEFEQIEEDGCATDILKRFVEAKPGVKFAGVLWPQSGLEPKDDDFMIACYADADARRHYKIDEDRDYFMLVG